MQPTFILAAGLALALALPGLAAGLVAGAVNPVVNGSFELQPPEEVGALVAGSPLDQCWGLGHQAQYGDETFQHDLVDANDPAAAADRIAADPAGQAVFTLGPGHCVFSADEGYDLVWLSPGASATKAAHWSIDVQAPSTRFGDSGLDASPDREAIIAADPALSHHNLWQAYPSPHQAFTGNFAALVFTIEAGSAPAGAFIQVSMSPLPLENTQGGAVIGIECGLNLRPGAGASGLVAMDPARGQFFSRDEPCDATAAAWNAAGSDAERRNVLGRLRIVQLSFWGFNTGSAAVVLDDVGLAGATSVADQVARGNVHLPA